MSSVQFCEVINGKRGGKDAWTRQKTQSACGCSLLPLAARIFSTLGKDRKQINADIHVREGVYFCQ